MTTLDLRPIPYPRNRNRNRALRTSRTLLNKYPISELNRFHFSNPLSLSLIHSLTHCFCLFQDKAHCPFHLKTGACRFGRRCSRVHFIPDKSPTLLIENMYNGPGLACDRDQDEGLEVCSFTSSYPLHSSLTFISQCSFFLIISNYISLPSAIFFFAIIIIINPPFKLFYSIFTLPLTYCIYINLHRFICLNSFFIIPKSTHFFIWYFFFLRESIQFLDSIIITDSLQDSFCWRLMILALVAQC